MQSRDESNEIINTQFYESQEDLKSRLLADLKKLKSAGAVSHTIGEIPSKGEFVEVNGLRYEVKFSDVKNGELHIKLVVSNI